MIESNNEDPINTNIESLGRVGRRFSQSENSFLKALIDEANNITGEVALALGGSVATMKNERLSDVDLFLYVAERNSFEQASNIRSALASHSSIVTSCPPIPYHSFGYRCAWTLINSDWSIVELFVSSAIDIKLTSLSKCNVIIIDRSLKYRDHVYASRELNDDASEETQELILHDIVAGAQKTRKALRSNSLLHAANRLYKLRMACISILVFSRTGQLHHPLVGEKHAGEMDPKALIAILDSYNIRSIDDIERHFNTIIGLVRPGIEALCRSGMLSEVRMKIITDSLMEYAVSTN